MGLRILQSRRGSVLMVTIIVLLFLSVLGMNLIVYLLSRATAATLELDRLKALYLAEAGIAKSVNELRLDKDFEHNGLGNVLKVKLGDGSYKAVHNFRLSTITGIGESNGVIRKIQIQYSSL